MDLNNFGRNSEHNHCFRCYKSQTEKCSRHGNCISVSYCPVFCTFSIFCHHVAGVFTHRMFCHPLVVGVYYNTCFRPRAESSHCYRRRQTTLHHQVYIHGHNHNLKSIPKSICMGNWRKILNNNFSWLAF